MNGPLAGLVGEMCPHLPLQGGVEEPVIGVLRGGPDKGHGPRPRPHHRPAEQHQGRLPVGDHGRPQKALPLPPVDRQDLVALEPGDGLGEVVVEPVDRVLLPGGPGGQLSPLQHQLPEDLADGGVVGDVLGDDVVGPLEGVGGGLHPLLGVDVGLGGLLRIRAVALLGEQQGRQRLQPLLPRRRGAGAALLLVGAVQVLHLRQGGGGVDGGGQRLRQLPLAVDSSLDLLPPLLQIAQVLQPLLQGAQGGVIHGAVELLAVAGDEGDGVALVQQGDDVGYVLLALIEFPG